MHDATVDRFGWHRDNLIDPAVHYTDRKLDLAMLDLFAGVPAALQAGYDAVWPLKRATRARQG